MKYWVLALAVLAVIGSARAQTIEVAPAAVKATGTLVDDEGAVGGKALLDEGAGRWFSHHVEVLPGHYRVSVRLAAGERRVARFVGTARLHVDGRPSEEDWPLPVAVEDFAGAGVYREFTHELAIGPRDASGKAGFYVVLDRANPPLSVRLGGITVERLDAGPVVVHRVFPQKLLAMTGTEQEFAVSVCNSGDAAQADLTLGLELVRDLGERIEVGTQPLALAAGENKELSFTWNVGQLEYGCEARAVVRNAAGEEVSRWQDWFAVSDSHFKLRIRGTARGGVAWMSKAGSVARVHSLRAAYGNFIEMYGWSPSAFVELMPRERFWRSGQVMPWCFDLEAIVARNEEMHRLGMYVTSYNISLFNGWPGQEYMRKHPEWCTFNEKGRPAGSVNTRWWQTRADVYSGDQPLPGMAEFPGEMPNSGRIYPLSDGVIRHGAAEIVRIAREMGFDGMRWDGHPIVYVTKKEGSIAGTEFGKMIWDWQGKDVNELLGGDFDGRSYHNMKLIKDTVAAVPNFEWGYNAGYDLTAVQQPKTWELVSRNAGLWIEGGFRSADEGRADPSNTWDKYIDKLWLSSRFCYGSGGYPIHGALNADSTIMRRFISALFYAQGSHAAWHGGTWGEWHNSSRFATRYCGYFFDPRLHPWWGQPDIAVTGWVQWELRNADAVPPLDTALVVNSQRPLFFPEKNLLVRDLSPTRRDTVFHLLNAPLKPYVDYTEMTPPPVQTDVGVRLKAPPGMHARAAACLSPDAWPYEQTVPVTADGDWVAVTVPRLETWTILVVEWEREG